MKLVFVHLGTQIPEYLFANILRTSLKFSDYELVLITDQIQNVKYQGLKVETIFYDAENLTAAERELLDTKSQDLAFRSGYWRWTTERILALKFAQEILDDSILHIESDVILLDSFPMNRMNEIAQQKPLMWCAHRPKEDVASLLYSRDPHGMEWLYSSLLSEMKEHRTYTDMSLLAQIRNKYPERISIFPFLNTSKVGDSNTTLKSGGIFDPLAIGIWLFGQDPRNNYGFSILRDKFEMRRTNPYMNPIHFDNICFKEPEIITVRYRGCESQVHSLHVHSKEIEAFEETEALLRDLILGVKSEFVVRKWNVKLMLSLLQSNYSGKTLQNYVKLFLKRIVEIIILKVKIRIQA